MKKKLFEDPIYRQFYAALTHMLHNEWKRKQSTLGMIAGISSSHMSGIAKGDKKPTFLKQKAIATACGYTYEQFLELGKNLLEKRADSETTKESDPKKKETPTVPVGNVIRVYNNILEKTGIKLDPEGQEKLFNLVRRKLAENQEKAVQEEFVDIISISDRKAE